jgi:signal transduction histidine kinase
LTRRKTPATSFISSTPPARISSSPPERVSESSIEAMEEAATSSRSRLLADVPSYWLDRLLVVAAELPLDDSEDAVVDTLVNGLAAILPTYAVGVCFVPGESQQQVVVKRVPAGMAERALGIDPTRIFLGFAHEHAFEVLGGAMGSTLHIASDDDPLDSERVPSVHVARRAALILGRALERSRANAAFQGARRELRSLESHVIQADKLASFGQIAAGVVHELNNPLTSIVAYADFLIRKRVAGGASAAAGAATGEDADDVERLRRISESANRMLRFTRDLVSYARPSSGVPTPVVVHSVIDQAVAFCEHVLAQVGARVDKRYGADVLTVRGMPEQLVQVFVNLVTNACHALPTEGGCVSIATELAEGGRRVRIVVEDNGHGIAPEHIEQVFAPFFTTKGESKGTGLGLSIVKSIVERHDGDIRVESEPQRGTRFILRIPSAQAR